MTTGSSSALAASVEAQDEAVSFCSDLIRIDSAVPDVVERPIAEFVAASLTDVGLDVDVSESEPGRTNVMTRLEGADPDAPPLLIHGHLDVVPANPDDWTYHPLSGEIVDGYVWGRGAVDMKGMDAMVLATVRELVRTGTTPIRPVVFAFVADEEQGGLKGARWLTEHRREWFDGCTEAIGEIGGFDLTLDNGRRCYLVETAEKGAMTVQVTVRGRAGHASMLNDANPLTILAEGVARVGRHRFTQHLIPTVEDFLQDIAGMLGTALDLRDLNLLDALVGRLGDFGNIVGATLRHTAQPTKFTAGYKNNVIPESAQANFDCRLVPGAEEDFLPEFRRVLGPEFDVEVLFRSPSVVTPWDGPITDTIQRALAQEDPDAAVLPYCVSAGTDAKHFNRLGMRCFGFAPMRLPADLQFSKLFHGVDERIPVDALRFGTRVLTRMLTENHAQPAVWS